VTHHSRTSGLSEMLRAMFPFNCCSLRRGRGCKELALFRSPRRCDNVEVGLLPFMTAKRAGVEACPCLEKWRECINSSAIGTKLRQSRILPFREIDVSYHASFFWPRERSQKSSACISLILRMIAGHPSAN
jgi:hypothetical protein